MRIFGLSAWRTLLVQSLTVFSLFVGLGLSLLATGILWRRACLIPQGDEAGSPLHAILTRVRTPWLVRYPPRKRRGVE